MRRDELYLRDIVEAAQEIGTFVDGITAPEFMTDALRRSAVLQKLIVIGEAAARLSKPLKAAHPDVAWGDIVAFRNFAVHAYFSVDWAMVWNTAAQEVPDVSASVERILQAFDEPRDDTAGG